VFFSIGGGFAAVCRAVLNAVVEPHHIATLNTTIGLIDTIMLMTMAPFTSVMLRKGFELGGVWYGLPFMFAVGLSVLATLATFLYKLPRNVLRPQLL
jgi:hypothetical protein